VEKRKEKLKDAIRKELEDIEHIKNKFIYNIIINMFKKIKNSNIYSILILVALLVFCCIFGLRNQLYTEGLTGSTSTGLKDYIYHSGTAHDSPPPPVVYPTCKPYQGTVWAFCGDKPIHGWGIGPEGQEKAIGNCNYAARNGKQWGACP
tara:strand:+ start:443 stop:889 length:447 start_codon:yes stop_codon:yes gene_type:complete